MKKIALLSLALVSAASAAQAQSGPRLGIRVGGTLANIGGKDADQVNGYAGDLQYKLGYNAGISYQLPLSSDGFWTLAPELLYNRKGFERSYETTGSALAANTDIEANRRTNLEKFKYQNKRVLSYIDLPIPVRINTAPGGSGLYFELGPQVGYMVASKQEVQKEYKYTDASNMEDAKTTSGTSKEKEDLASFDIGGVAGIGYQTAGGFSIGVRYNQGFKTLFDTKNTSARNEPKAFNRAFTAQVGYLIPWGK
ncbi:MULTISPECIES: porin family protein [Hymenobacter]|uniref:PorT family protein n=2 Tax=Hymenobacter TaxID=89966 RepID=A0ABS6X171_9BACT|nr:MULTISPECIES: porin family protein [Hymenobacter]MBO3270314.1 PorT family protein [Hymenobacter defluvii]MBW3129586.1 PorT family protein [Hymenobacter profundi]QNE38058.1 PorT family protein [Hymenobacter sp. NBH84]